MSDNTQPIEDAHEQGLRDIHAALLRAAQLARELSIRTRVPLVVVNRDGVIEYLMPWLPDDPKQADVR